MRAIFVVAVDPFLCYFSNLLERFKDVGIKNFMVVSAFGNPTIFSRCSMTCTLVADKFRFTSMASTLRLDLSITF